MKQTKYAVQESRLVDSQKKMWIQKLSARMVVWFLLSVCRRISFFYADKNKDEILNKLTEEIVKRYYYTEGVYQQKATFDKAILRAATLLNNSNEYDEILNN